MQIFDQAGGCEKRLKVTPARVKMTSVLIIDTHYKL